MENLLSRTTFLPHDHPAVIRVIKFFSTILRLRTTLTESESRAPPFGLIRTRISIFTQHERGSRISAATVPIRKFPTGI